MAKVLTRAEYIKKVKRSRFFQKTAWKILIVFLNLKRASQRKEIYLETGLGRVRALGYGFENTEEAPVFFDLHGGGFVLGGAELDEDMNDEIHKRAGCKVLSLDYPKAPEHPYPAAVNQIYAAVRHVYENAEEYAIDAKRMAIGGHSAGANLSTVACMKAKHEGLFQFACQVLDYPPLDLATSAWEKPQPKGCIPPETALMFDACYVDPAQARDPYVSPVYATGEELEGLPPALFILPGGDSLHAEGLKYRNMLMAAGVATECHEYPDAVHGFTYKPSADTTDALEKMSAFLRKYLS